MDVIGSVKSVSGTQPETVIGIYIKADDCFMERGLVDESECFLFPVPLSISNPVFMDKLNTLSGTFIHQAGDMMNSTYMAGKMLYNQLIQQSTLCAYMTTFKVFSIACFILIPFMFLLKGEKK